MDIANQFTPEVTIIVSAFALAWLLVGIILDIHLRRGNGGGSAVAVRAADAMEEAAK